jgi:hypothetical protein
VRRRDDVAGLVSLATQRYGRLDVLVSNVGVGLVSALDDLRVEVQVRTAQPRTAQAVRAAGTSSGR